MHMNVRHKPTDHQAYRWEPGEPGPEEIKFAISDGRVWTCEVDLRGQVAWVNAGRNWYARMRPGDYVVLQPDGTLDVLNEGEFEEQYEEWSTVSETTGANVPAVLLDGLDFLKGHIQELRISLDSARKENQRLLERIAELEAQCESRRATHSA